MAHRRSFALRSIPVAVVAGAALLALGGCAAPPAGRAPAAQPGQGTVPQEEPFFVGLWAAEERLCDDPWRFTAEGIETPAHVVCHFDRLSRVPEGYRAESTCMAEAPPAPATITLSYAQSAKALLVEGAPFEDIGLVACPSGG